MATEVAVINASSGVQTFYSTYAAARSAASSDDLIQIWADLDEQILLKNGVDITILPGRVLDMTSAMPTIIDNDGSYSDAVTCNISGNGIIKNSYTGGGSSGEHYECIKIVNASSKVLIQCDYIEGIGTVYDPLSEVNQGYSIFVEGIGSSSKFHLLCNKVINKNNSAIVFSLPSEQAPFNDVNIRVQTIQTGISGQSGTGRTAVSLTGSGYVEIDEIICLYKGSCFIHKSGNIVATILKMTTSDQDLPALSVGEGDGTQNLTLYYDEIQNLNNTSGDSVVITQGVANLIGRRIYSNKGRSLDLKEYIVSANIQCVEIISTGRCININNSNEQIIIEANYIEGNTGSSDGVVYCNGGGNFLLRNAKIKNLRTSGTSTFSIGIYLGFSGTINMQLENIIVVTGDTDPENARTIVSATSRDVKNLGLFVNKPISGITLKIGKSGNFKYIISDEIT